MGVCSALYEFGGMTIMHDPSGCNSTYTTHDEPRWNTKPSQIFISALSEMEAIMGDDNKFIDDVVAAAKALNPAFITIAGTPIPTMIGFDFDAVTGIIEQETGIPTLGVKSTGMNSYVHGASLAFQALAKRFVAKQDRPAPNPDRIKINVLGLTPLDFSTVGNDTAILKILEDAGYEIIANFGMAEDSSGLLDGVKRAGLADVNLVVSSTGMGVAKYLEEHMGIPYVIGTPTAGSFAVKLNEAIKKAALSGKSINLPASLAYEEKTDIAIIGEPVTAMSMAAQLELNSGKAAKVVCSTDLEYDILRACDVDARFEQEIEKELMGMKLIIADPMFKPIIPSGADFISIPHEAFSGRTYKKEISNTILNFPINI